MSIFCILDNFCLTELEDLWPIWLPETKSGMPKYDITVAEPVIAFKS
jgi:hypothetical protein